MENHPFSFTISPFKRLFMVNLPVMFEYRRVYHDMTFPIIIIYNIIHIYIYVYGYTCIYITEKEMQIQSKDSWKLETKMKLEDSMIM